MESKIAVIDCDSLIFSAFHPNKVLGFDGKPLRTEDDKRFIYKDKTLIEIMESCDFLMDNMLTKSKASGYIAYVKGRNTVKNKLLIDPNYKADRGTISPKFWNFTKEYLKLNWGATEANDAETDDFVNITRLKLPNAFICAIDSDLLGLEGKHWNWRENKWITTTMGEADYKFYSDMICGTHNNTKGIPGKGEKYAEKVLVDEFSSKGNYIVVYEEYIKHFGKTEGIQEFYKNYMLTHILDQFEGFVLPEIIEYKKNVEEIF